MISSAVGSLNANPTLSNRPQAQTQGQTQGITGPVETASRALSQDQLQSSGPPQALTAAWIEPARNARSTDAPALSQLSKQETATNADNRDAGGQSGRVPPPGSAEAGYLEARSAIS